jgi:hypothetical protein
MSAWQPPPPSLQRAASRRRHPRPRVGVKAQEGRCAPSHHLAVAAQRKQTCCRHATRAGGIPCTSTSTSEEEFGAWQPEGHCCCPVACAAAKTAGTSFVALSIHNKHGAHVALQPAKSGGNAACCCTTLAAPLGCATLHPWRRGAGRGLCRQGTLNVLPCLHGRSRRLAAKPRLHVTISAIVLCQGQGG